MPIKDKEVNKNVINIKIGDIDKKKKVKNKKRKMVQKAKQVGSFSYAPSAPSHRPLHPQVPTQSTHYNRAQEANLSTLIGTEAELKQTLNTLFDNTASELRKSRDRERALNSYIDNNISRSSSQIKNTPAKGDISSIKANDFSPQPFSLFASDIKKDNSLHNTTLMSEKNNKKADILLQKTPSNNTDPFFLLSPDTDRVKSAKSPSKTVRIMEEIPAETKPVKSRITRQKDAKEKATVEKLRSELRTKGFPVSFKDEEGRTHLFTKKQILERYDFIKDNDDPQSLFFNPSNESNSALYSSTDDESGLFSQIKESETY